MGDTETMTPELRFSKYTVIRQLLLLDVVLCVGAPGEMGHGAEEALLPDEKVLRPLLSAVSGIMDLALKGI